MGLARRLALSGRRPEAVLRLLALADAPEARALLGALELTGEDASPPPRTPRLRWRMPVRELVSYWSGPSGSRALTVAGAALLLVEQRGRPRVVSLDPRSGEHRWSRSFADDARLEVVQDQLVVAEEGRAVVLDAWTGDRVHERRLAWPAALWPGGDALAVVAADEVTILAAPSWQVRARSPLRLEEHRPLGLTAWGLLLGVDGEPRTVRALDPATAAERWRAPARTFRFCADGAGLVSESPAGRLELRAPDGRLVWSVEAPEGWLGLSRDAVLVGSSRGVSALDRVRGERRVLYPWPTEPPVAVAGGLVLVHDPGHQLSAWFQRRGRTSGGEDGFGEAQARSLDVPRSPRLRALDLGSGQPVWELDLAGWPQALQLATLGDLLITLTDDALAAFGPGDARSSA